METKCILRGNEMHFVGSKSLYVLLCPLPGSVQYRFSDITKFILWYNKIDLVISLNRNEYFISQNKIFVIPQKRLGNITK